jgi:hypothetical protein
MCHHSTCFRKLQSHGGEPRCGTRPAQIIWQPAIMGRWLRFDLDQSPSSARAFRDRKSPIYDWRMGIAIASCWYQEHPRGSTGECLRVLPADCPLDYPCSGITLKPIKRIFPTSHLGTLNKAADALDTSTFWFVVTKHLSKQSNSH